MLLAAPARVLAEDAFIEAARELAGKIQAGLGQQKNISFTFKSIASLSAQDAEMTRQTLRKELHARNVRLVPEAQADAAVTVILSENMQQYIWIAEIGRGNTRELLMATRERLPRVPPMDAGLPMAIQARQIFEHEKPILDLKFLEENLLVLNPESVAQYRRAGEEWDLERSFTLPITEPLPRDVRGRIEETDGGVHVYLPGLFCKETDRRTFAFTCSREEKTWPLPLDRASLAAGRNFFTRENLPPFYAIADMKSGQSLLWTVAAVDGRSYLYDSSFMRIDMLGDGWGSDMAAVDSECGTRRQLLAALRTDPFERSAIQAFEIMNKKAAARSSVMELSGPITVLWPDKNRNVATAVVRDLKTGRYAAFHLSISCSR